MSSARSKEKWSTLASTWPALTLAPTRTRTEISRPPFGKPRLTLSGEVSAPLALTPVVIVPRVTVSYALGVGWPAEHAATASAAASAGTRRQPTPAGRVRRITQGRVIDTPRDE